MWACKCRINVWCPGLPQTILSRSAIVNIYILQSLLKFFGEISNLSLLYEGVVSVQNCGKIVKVCFGHATTLLQDRSLQGGSCPPPLEFDIFLNMKISNCLRFSRVRMPPDQECSSYPKNYNPSAKTLQKNCLSINFFLGGGWDAPPPLIGVQTRSPLVRLCRLPHLGRKGPTMGEGAYGFLVKKSSFPTWHWNKSLISTWKK